jgi:hypothetical protein
MTFLFSGWVQATRLWNWVTEHWLVRWASALWVSLPHADLSEGPAFMGTYANIWQWHQWWSPLKVSKGINKVVFPPKCKGAAAWLRWPQARCSSCFQVQVWRDMEVVEVALCHVRSLGCCWSLGWICLDFTAMDFIWFMITVLQPSWHTQQHPAVRYTKAEDLVKGLCKKDPSPGVFAGWMYTAGIVPCLDLWDSSATLVWRGRIYAEHILKLDWFLYSDLSHLTESWIFCVRESSDVLFRTGSFWAIAHEERWRRKHKKAWGPGLIMASFSRRT